MPAPLQLDGAVAEQARNTLGLVTVAQLMALGVTEQRRRTLARNGILVPLTGDVLRHAAWPRSWRQAVLAAVLHAGDGAVASHMAAAALWEFDGINRGAVEVTVPHPRQPRPRAGRVHRSRDLVTADVDRQGPIPITTPARTLLDIAPRLRPRRPGAGAGRGRPRPPRPPRAAPPVAPGLAATPGPAGGTSPGGRARADQWPLHGGELARAGGAARASSCRPAAATLPSPAPPAGRRPRSRRPVLGGGPAGGRGRRPRHPCHPTATAGRRRPIWTRFKKKDAVLFERRNNSTREVPPDEVEQFITERFRPR